MKDPHIRSIRVISRCVPTAEPVEKKLAAVADKGGSHKDMAEKYCGVLGNILKSKASLAEALKAFAEAMVQENVNLVVSRPILQVVCAGLTSMPDAVAKEVAHFAHERLQPRVYRSNRHVLEHVEGEIINNRLLFQVATLPPASFEHRRRGTRVARTGESPLGNSPQKQYPVEYKMESYLKIARLYSLKRRNATASSPTDQSSQITALYSTCVGRATAFAHLERIIRGLQFPHRKALTSDGTSILDWAGEKAV